jgi:hypothetical protein
VATRAHVLLAACVGRHRRAGKTRRACQGTGDSAREEPSIAQQLGSEEQEDLPGGILATRTEKTCSSVGHAERIVSNPHRIVPNELAQAAAARGTSRTNTPFTADPNSDGSRTPSSTKNGVFPTISVDSEKHSE